jgi:hypothetical protein
MDIFVCRTREGNSGYHGLPVWPGNFSLEFVAKLLYRVAIAAADRITRRLH